MSFPWLVVKEGMQKSPVSVEWKVILCCPASTGILLLCWQMNFCLEVHQLEMCLFKSLASSKSLTLSLAMGTVVQEKQKNETVGYLVEAFFFFLCFSDLSAPYMEVTLFIVLQ